MQAKLSGKKRSLSKAEGTIADDNRFLGFQRGQRLKLRPRLRMSHLVESAVAVFMEGRACELQPFIRWYFSQKTLNAVAQSPEQGLIPSRGGLSDRKAIRPSITVWYL